MATTYGKDYKDYDINFSKHPAHGDLVTVKKTKAINRSINNVIRAQAGERLFQPNVSGGLNALLFEPFGRLTETRIEASIESAIKRFEPRAKLRSVTVEAKERDNSYRVMIEYVPDNDVNETTLEVYLERT